MLKKWKEYLTWERTNIQRASAYINQRNRSLLVLLLSAMVVMYLGLLGFGLATSSYVSFQMLYLTMLVYMAICLIMVLKMPTMPPGYLTYGIDIVTILLSMYASAFVDPDYINTEAYIFFLLFPALYLDTSVRMDVVNTSLAAMYLACILRFKNGKAMVLESISIVCFALLGMVVGHFVRVHEVRSAAVMERSAREKLRDPLTGLPNHVCLSRALEGAATQPQAVLLIEVRELADPVRFFGTDFLEEQLRRLGDALVQAAGEQGIDLYCCGSGIVGIVQPRLPQGVFQRLEALHHTLKYYVYRHDDGRETRLHFGIGAALCEGGFEKTFARACAACEAAQHDGMNRIVLESL